jgi:hypothetical protein
MIKITVESQFKGCVAIRDKYIKEAMETHQQIEVRYYNDFMIVDPERFAFKSQFPFKDRYSKAEHYLYYYKWNPDSRQTGYGVKLEKASDDPQQLKFI